MCLACEQDAMWLAYLRRKGLITPDGYLVEEPPSLFEAVDTPAVAQENPAPEAANDANAAGSADKSSLSCDDPNFRDDPKSGDDFKAQ
jgi:hypothetical protein